jgi:hypothetical protein
MLRFIAAGVPGGIHLALCTARKACTCSRDLRDKNC